MIAKKVLYQYPNDESTLFFYFLCQVTISPHLLEVSAEDDSEAHTEKKEIKDVELGIPDLFKHSGCRNATLIMFVVWIAVTLGTNDK